MDLNALKKRMIEEQEKAINYQSKAGGFADDLKKAIEQNDATYKPFENDVNQSRNSYYNTTGSLLPEITKKQQYANDPMLALQALENERTIGGTRYQNAQDSLQRRKGSIGELIEGFNKSALNEVQRQSSLSDLLAQQYQTAFQEDQARKAAAAQRAALNAQLSASRAQGQGQVADKTYDKPGQNGEIRKGADGVERVYDASIDAWVDRAAWNAKMQGLAGQKSQGDFGQEAKKRIKEIPGHFGDLIQAGGAIAQGKVQVSDRDKQLWNNITNGWNNFWK